jgi:hypothetical protein
VRSADLEVAAAALAPDVENCARARLLLVANGAAGFDRFVFEGGEPATGPAFHPRHRLTSRGLSQLAARYGHEALGPLPQ